MSANETISSPVHENSEAHFPLTDSEKGFGTSLGLLFECNAVLAPVFTCLGFFLIGKLVEKTRNQKPFNDFNKHTNRLKYIEKEILVLEVRLQLLNVFISKFYYFYIVSFILGLTATSIAFYIEWHRFQVASGSLITIFVGFLTKMGANFRLRLKARTLEKLREEQEQTTTKRRRSIQGFRQSIDPKQLKIMQEEFKKELVKEKKDLRKEIYETNTKITKTKEQQQKLQKEKNTLSQIFFKVTHFVWCDTCNEKFTVEDLAPSNQALRKVKSEFTITENPERLNEGETSCRSSRSLEPRKIQEEEEEKAESSVKKPASPGTLTSLDGNPCRKQCIKKFYALCSKLSKEYQTLKENIDS